MNVNTKEEVWEDVKGYEGFYRVSDHGRIKRISRHITSKNGVTRFWKGRILSQTLNPDGYPMCILSKDGKTKVGSIHRIVAEAFVSNPENLPVVNHKDENKENNEPKNLEWCTVAHNNAHGTRTERMKNNKQFKENHERLKMPVMKFALSGKLLERFDSLEIAFNSSAEFTKSGVHHCCTSRLNTYKGFFWIYEEDFTEEELKNRIAKTKKTQCKKVNQLDLEGKLIKSYNSMGQASREMGINSGSIHCCCTGKMKKIGNFKWEYAD